MTRWAGTNYSLGTNIMQIPSIIKPKDLKEEEEINNNAPDFLKDVCPGCGKSIKDVKTVPVAKRNCSQCVLRFFTKNDNKGRDHNFNLKVKVKVVGYDCMDCGKHFNSLSEVNEECSGQIDVPLAVTPVPFKPSKIIEGIHAPKWKPFTPIKERVARVQSSKPKVKPVPKKSLSEEMPDFLK
jgi:hypothetical protein